MRMFVTVRCPNEPFNSLVRKGSAGKLIGKILASIKPESVYFTEIDGQRTALLIVDVEKASQIPALAEPWFLNFNAGVRFHPVMSSDDLQKAGLAELGKKWG